MGLGNKLLSGKIRNKIGLKIINKLKINSVSVKDIDKELYIPVKYKNSNLEMFLCKIKDAKVYSSWGFYFTTDDKIIKETLPFERRKIIIILYLRVKQFCNLKNNIFIIININYSNIQLINFFYSIINLLNK